MATARLVAAFGDHRVSDEGLRSLWLTELLGAFGAYNRERMVLAFSMVIRRCKFWPTIAEIAEAVRDNAPLPPTMEEKVAEARRRLPEPPLTKEEIERRGIVVANLKVKYGYGKTEVLESDPRVDEPFCGFEVAESDISPALRAAMVKQRR